MVVCDLLRALFAFCLVVAPNAYVVLLLVIVKGIFHALFDPARQSAIKVFVPEDILLQANAISQFSVNFSKVLGPALGGIVLAVSTPQTAFVIDGISFLLSAFILIYLPSGKQRTITQDAECQQKGTTTNFWNELKEGIAYVVKTHILLLLMIFNGAVFFNLFLFDSLSVLLAKGMGFTETQFAFFTSAVGLGSLVGTLIIGRYGNQLNQVLMMTFSAVFLGFFIAITGLGSLQYVPSWLSLWFAIWLLIGACIAFITVSYGYLLQVSTPEHMMGRVSSIGNAIINGFIVIAPAIGAFLAGLFQVGGVFFLSGCAMILLGAATAYFTPQATKTKRSIDQSCS
ncbi:MFS transporter [Paenibacillus profundus]|uniref:MFS transporter n=1 Tax=Paenibacillus profundus TaxID=1173085 RepID=A0ABS8YHX1_9BACL|nr:MFS transporter [Paenibacillus profundus]MCE5170742.1 MFS transporter [Paenibacillus profundus]